MSSRIKRYVRTPDLSDTALRRRYPQFLSALHRNIRQHWRHLDKAIDASSNQEPVSMHWPDLCGMILGLCDQVGHTEAAVMMRQIAEPITASHFGNAGHEE